jgi:hypothetical protein
MVIPKREEFDTKNLELVLLFPFLKMPHLSISRYPIFNQIYKFGLIILVGLKGTYAAAFLYTGSLELKNDWF